MFLMLCSVLAVVLARPDSILDFDGDDHEHEQNGDAGDAVEGSYRFVLLFISFFLFFNLRNYY